MEKSVLPNRSFDKISCSSSDISRRNRRKPNTPATTGRAISFPFRSSASTRGIKSLCKMQPNVSPTSEGFRNDNTNSQESGNLKDSCRPVECRTVGSGKANNFDKLRQCLDLAIQICKEDDNAAPKPEKCDDRPRPESWQPSPKAQNLSASKSKYPYTLHKQHWNVYP